MNRWRESQNFPWSRGLDKNISWSHIGRNPETQGIRWEFWPTEYLRQGSRRNSSRSAGTKGKEAGWNKKSLPAGCKAEPRWTVSRFRRVECTLEMVQATEGPRSQWGPNGEKWECQALSVFPVSLHGCYRMARAITNLWEIKSLMLVPRSKPRVTYGRLRSVCLSNFWLVARLWLSSLCSVHGVC